MDGRAGVAEEGSVTFIQRRGIDRAGDVEDLDVEDDGLRVAGPQPVALVLDEGDGRGRAPAEEGVGVLEDDRPGVRIGHAR